MQRHDDESNGCKPLGFGGNQNTTQQADEQVDPIRKNQFTNQPTALGETGTTGEAGESRAKSAPSSHQGISTEPPVAPTNPVSPGASPPSGSNPEKPHTPAGPGASPPTPTRPRTRGDCLAGPRPCPWIGCKWHLCWERRDIKRVIMSDAHPAMAASLIMSMDQTCVLDVSEAPRSDREVGAVLGITHQAVAQACQRGMTKLRAKQILRRGQEEVCGPSAPPAWRWGAGDDPVMSEEDD